MVHQNKAPTAYPAVGAFILVARSEDSNRATAPQCRNQQSSGLLVSPRESPRGMGKEAERAGGRDVAAIQPYGKRRALFYCNNPECCDSLCTIGGREQPRRRPPPAAETGSRSRGRGRRGDVPPKGRWPMRAPQPVGPRRLAYRRAKTVQWTILERKSLHSLIGRKGGCTIPFGAGSCVVQALAFASRGPVANFAPY